MLQPLSLQRSRLGILFLYKLRAFENVVEWLPVFIIHAVALVALGRTGICVLLCVPYTIGHWDRTMIRENLCGSRKKNPFLVAKN